MQVGLQAALFHKKLPPPVRQQALETLRGSADGRVLVCTDAAARGLDLTTITHVVQADFADNAVDFLHRIGRTARGDRCAAPALHSTSRFCLCASLRFCGQVLRAVPGWVCVKSLGCCLWWCTSECCHSAVLSGPGVAGRAW